VTGPDPGRTRLYDLDVRALGEPPHGIGELEMLGLHHVAEDVASPAAPEAVPQLCGRVDLEARGLLGVERAVAPEQPALPLQHDAFRDE